MRILYVLNDTFRRGGTESVVFNYFSHLDPEKCRIDFMIHTTRKEAEGNAVYQRLVGQGTLVHIVTPRRISVKQNIADMTAVFQKVRYDIVHAHADCANAIILSVAKKNGIAVRIAHSHNTKSPIEVKDVKSLLHKAYLEWCRIRVPKVATHYMACSDQAGRWLFGEGNMRAGRVYILNNAVDVERFRYNAEKREQVRQALQLGQSFVVGHVGRFSPQKNHPFILRMAADLAAKAPDVKLLLVGDGPDYQKTREEASTMGLDNVVFYGSTDRVSDVMQTFDCFILPSLWEGLPVVVVEAQTNGLQCFVSDNEKVSKTSKLTPLVEFVPLVDPAAWSERILAFRNHAGRRDYADLIAQRGFDISRESKGLETYYLKTLNKDWT